MRLALALAALARGGRCRWFQTADCDPKGRVEQPGGEGCGTRVEAGTSGYCQCADGRKVRQETCDHPAFTCDDACAEPAASYECLGWRQTGDCASDGPREAAKDLACDQPVDGDRSGFCECGNGRVVLLNGCWLSKVAAVPPFTCAAVCAAGPSYYELLGLDVSADEKAVQKNFRRVSLKNHPDKDPSAAAAARYRAIREAYDVLGDPAKKVVYRMGGAKLLQDLQGGKTDTSQASKIELQISMEQLYTGTEFVQPVRRKVVCRGCAQSRASWCAVCTEKCADEKQMVNVRMGPMIFQQEQYVPSKEKCRHVSEPLPILLEPGTRDGTEIVFKAMGEQWPKQIPGDLVITLKQREHKTFKRQVDSLVTELDLTLKEMLLGFKRTIKHLDNHEVQLEVTGPIAVGSVLKIDGEGMPRPKDVTVRGPLVVKLNLLMPDELSDAQYEAIENLF